MIANIQSLFVFRTGEVQKYGLQFLVYKAQDVNWIILTVTPRKIMIADIPSYNMTLNLDPVYFQNTLLLIVIKRKKVYLVFGLIFSVLNKIWTYFKTISSLLWFHAFLIWIEGHFWSYLWYLRLCMYIYIHTISRATDLRCSICGVNFTWRSMKVAACYHVLQKYFNTAGGCWLRNQHFYINVLAVITSVRLEEHQAVWEINIDNLNFLLEITLIRVV